jgi:hypothetical protein
MVENSKIISFRVSPEEYAHLERIAAVLAEKGKIKNDSVNTLVKAFMYVKVNEFIQLGLLQKEAERREETRPQERESYV